MFALPQSRIAHHTTLIGQLTANAGITMVRPPFRRYAPVLFLWVIVMKVRNSIKSLAKRHRQNRVVRRRGRIYVINKTNRRFKARQG